LHAFHEHINIINVLKIPDISIILVRNIYTITLKSKSDWIENWAQELFINYIYN